MDVGAVLQWPHAMTMAREKRHYGKLLTDLLPTALGNLCTLLVTEEADPLTVQFCAHKSACVAKS